MSFVSIPNPDGTKRNCKYGCGLMTVLADIGGGRMERLHCGTFRTTCPGKSTPHIATRPDPVLSGHTV